MFTEQDFLIGRKRLKEGNPVDWALVAQTRIAIKNGTTILPYDEDERSVTEYEQFTKFFAVHADNAE
jgi:hypothetical protein